MRPETRVPLAPDLVAFDKEPGGQVVSLKIKAPCDRSVRPLPHFYIATELMALLKLHFCDEVLVLRKEVAEVAQFPQNCWNGLIENFTSAALQDVPSFDRWQSRIKVDKRMGGKHFFISANMLIMPM